MDHQKAQQRLRRKRALEIVNNQHSAVVVEKKRSFDAFAKSQDGPVLTRNLPDIFPLHRRKNQISFIEVSTMQHYRFTVRGFRSLPIKLPTNFALL
jgi:hypothetical protein